MRSSFNRTSILIKRRKRDFSGGPGVKNPLCNADEVGSVPDPELRSHLLRSN